VFLVSEVPLYRERVCVYERDRERGAENAIVCVRERETKREGESK